MISVQNLTVDFGKQTLFKSINFVITPKDRIALVGKNGAGKSTLLKLLAGLEQPTSGSIERPKQIRIGYLPQVMTFSETLTVLEEVKKVFSEIFSLEEEYSLITQEMAQRTDYESDAYKELIEHYSHLTELLQVYHKGSYLAEIEKTLLGLGFERTDFDRLTSEFSGGWRMRIELAKVLLSKPDILLLDEPTNHLDIESIEWLERYLQINSVAIVLVSHDRAFIDATTRRTIEIELGQIYDYKTNYSHYLDLRKERVEQQLKAYENQQKKIEEAEAFIERFRYKATKSTQVQSRIKQLDKIDRIEVDVQDLKHISFSFLQADRSGDFPVIVENLYKSYGEKEVLNNVSLTIHRGEKVAFLGKNGSGKSTLIKCFTQDITDYQGGLKIGYGTQIAYFSQNMTQELPEAQTIREAIDRAAVGPIREHINDLLGAFMFGGELADKPIRVLSGGERSRVAIMLLLLKPANLLILDEPTNHLDIRSKEVLKEAIRRFKGTVVLVSHDRFFLDGLVDKVYEFSYGKIREYMGGVVEYLEYRRSTSGVDSLRTKTEDLQSIDRELLPNNGEASSFGVYQRQKDRNKQMRRLRKIVEEAEEEITLLEKSCADIEIICASGKANAEDFDRYGKLQKELNAAIERWEQAEQELAEFAS